MKEFIEKLIGRLEEGIYSFEERLKFDAKTQKHLISQNNGIKYAITIINELAKEHKGGWIPCSERLPETDDDVLCWYEYYRFGEYNGMYQTYGIGHYWKAMDFWGGEVSNGMKCRVIAWQPLPDPYQQKEGEE